MAAKKKVETIEIVQMNVKTMVVSIEGTSDLVLNKMNASSTRSLLADNRKQEGLREAQHKNKWEDIITSIHWRDGIPCEDTNHECTEEMFYEMLKTNAPCITQFGLKKSWTQAVVQNEIDKYGTKFANAANVSANKGLIPIKFASHYIDERIMSPKRGSPVTVRLNHFVGWSADITVNYTDHVYSAGEIVNIINCAGFGIGIGSGRTSGFGRYKVVGVK